MAMPHGRHGEGTMKSRQTGITLIGFLIVLAVVGFFAFMAMKLLPSYSEYMGVVKAMNQTATDGTEGKSLDDIRRGMFFKMNFQYVDDATIKPKDITLVRDPNGATQLHVVYDKQIPFMYNISFLLHFEKSVPLKGNVGE
jgi:type II secretory pathway pseudopilin PulG